jgi:hypothetical protein
VTNVAFSSASLLGVQRLRDLIVGEQRANALHFFGIGELAIFGDGADQREGFQDPVVKKPDEHFERFIALLASHVTLVLVLAKRAVVKGLQTGQEDIDQVVVQPIVLMRDKGNEMQIPFPLGASGQLKDLGFDDAIVRQPASERRP